MKSISSQVLFELKRTLNPATPRNQTMDKLPQHDGEISKEARADEFVSEMERVWTRVYGPRRQMETKRLFLEALSSVKEPEAKETDSANATTLSADKARELRKLIGEPPEGSHPDEWKPRAETWHQERLNWIVEVESNRKQMAKDRDAITLLMALIPALT